MTRELTLGDILRLAVENTKRKPARKAKLGLIWTDANDGSKFPPALRSY